MVMVETAACEVCGCVLESYQLLCDGCKRVVCDIIECPNCGRKDECRVEVGCVCDAPVNTATASVPSASSVV